MVSESQTQGPRVVHGLGQTPNCWEQRSVIFFANLLSLFFGNRGGARLLEEEIRWVDSYGGRLLPVLGLIFGGKDNVLVLERPPEPALEAFFGKLGLALPKLETLTRSGFLELSRSLKHGNRVGEAFLDRIRREPAGMVDGFVTDKAIGRIAAELGKETLATPDGSHRGNNKLLLHQHLERAGLPTFPTRLAASCREIPAAIKALKRDGYRHAVIKAQIGASGIGLLKTPTDHSPDDLPSAFFHEGACMVQAWLEPGVHDIAGTLSPSVQIFLSRETAHLYDLTEQILDPAATIHQGNESPPPYLERFPQLADELLSQAGEVADWLHRQGYQGAASVDFLVTIDSRDATTVHVCEINARVTGATYPSVLARHFRPRGAWRMRNLELAEPMTGDRLLEGLRKHGELFDPGDSRGIIPVNFNLDSSGLVRKGQFLAVAGETPECRHLLDTARGDLPVIWDYTHDR